AAWSFSLEFARPVTAGLVGRDRAPALRSLRERHQEPAEYLAAAVVRGEAVRRELLSCWDPHCITFRAADGGRVAVEARTLHGGPPHPTVRFVRGSGATRVPRRKGHVPPHSQRCATCRTARMEPRRCAPAGRTLRGKRTSAVRFRHPPVPARHHGTETVQERTSAVRYSLDVGVRRLDEARSGGRKSRRSMPCRRISSR